MQRLLPVYQAYMKIDVACNVSTRPVYLTHMKIDVACNVITSWPTYTNNGTGWNFLTSNRPLSPILRSGITRRAMNESVMNGAFMEHPFC
jgi:hypothetical protein